MVEVVRHTGEAEDGEREKTREESGGNGAQMGNRGKQGRLGKESRGNGAQNRNLGSQGGGRGRQRWKDRVGARAGRLKNRAERS